MSVATLSHRSEATADKETAELNYRAQRRLLETERGGILRSDWIRVVFIHFQIDPAILARHTPFELDLYEGRAYVSLVAFLMRRFRVRGTGMIGSALCAPAARHGLLNVRTYVRRRGEPGICFLTEWIPNRLSVMLGPRLFRLPYRFARLNNLHDPERGQLRGAAQTSDGRHRLDYEAVIDPSKCFRPALTETLDEFLLERYTAFTTRRGRASVFRIWHEPWHQVAIDPHLSERSLLNLTGTWLEQTVMAGGHYSPGVRDVWIGRPHWASP